jgi:hypothetical protein
MRLFIIQRGDDNIGFCPVIETARLTEEEAETYVAEQERMALGMGDEASYWTIVDVDLPLSPTTPRTMSEGARVSTT